MAVKRSSRAIGDKQHLNQIPGISGKLMSALFDAGVYTISDLNAANPNVLHMILDAQTSTPAERTVISRLIESKRNRDLISAESHAPSTADHEDENSAPPRTLANAEAPSIAPQSDLTTAEAPLASATQHAVPSEPNRGSSAA